MSRIFFYGLFMDRGLLIARGAIHGAELDAADAVIDLEQAQALGRTSRVLHLANAGADHDVVPRSAMSSGSSRRPAET